MKDMSISKFFITIHSILIVIVLLLTTNSYIVSRIENEIRKLKEYRFEAHNFADDIIASSDLLNRLAKNYVVTGNKKFYDSYQNANKRKTKNVQPTNSLLNKQLSFVNFNKEEKTKLLEAKEFEKKLRAIDKVAFNALNGVFDDGYGNYKTNQADTTFAIKQLFSASYFSLNESVTFSVDAFLQIVKRENNLAIEIAEQQQLYQTVASYLLSLIALVIIIVSHLLIIGKIIRPTVALEKLSNNISQGEYNLKLEANADDEIGRFAKAINTMMEGIKTRTEFITQIRNNNLNTHLAVLSDKDEMAKSLILMRDNLIENKRREEQQIEIDRQRTWQTEGLAMFSELLRKHTNNNEIAQNIISNIIKYLELNQGGLYIISEAETERAHVEMIACYAYDRIRKQKVKLSIDEGLIGRAIYEQNTIYLTEIPEDYITITSGLGDAPPSTLLIVPLKLNDQILGLVELAAFKEIPAYKIEFVEKLGESIAATISTAKINTKTNMLLKESREQAEIMAAQEEEMMQNIEELQATQDALDQNDREQKAIITKLNAEKQEQVQLIKEKEFEISGIYKAINNHTQLLEVNLDGKINFATNSVYQLLGITQNMIADVNIWNCISAPKSEANNEIKELKKGLKAGNSYLVNSLFVTEKKQWLHQTYTPIFDKNNDVKKIVLLLNNSEENNNTTFEIKLLS